MLKNKLFKFHCDEIHIIEGSFSHITIDKKMTHTHNKQQNAKFKKNIMKHSSNLYFEIFYSTCRDG